MEKIREIELLAPAKDLECGIAAINYGADAVYIGASDFGARNAAVNSVEDIDELVRYAHKYWAKIYVTVNTLLYDNEIPKVLELISQLYDIHVDGLIIQDAGLLECDLPPIPLIASTQMHNNTPEKVAFLEKVGFQRAILARELDLKQIRDVHRHTKMELECFIHGALCVCYSGQCYMSYALGGRSGNRGMCAQPCRKSYSLVDATGREVVSNKHLLSLKDLNLSEHLRELINVGICSFKIEGRLKDKAYVSNVVAYYRQKLDEALAELKLNRSSSGTSKIEFTPNLAKTFNRGYTTYFLQGRDAKIGSINTPKMMGEVLGKVLWLNKKCITIDSDIPVHAGDGICFVDRRGELRGTVINGTQGDTILPDKLNGMEIGTVIYRNHDHEFLTRLAKARVERQIAVMLTLGEIQDGFSLTAVDEDDNLAEINVSCDKTLAQKPEQAMANIEKQLLKSGGTDFICTDVDIKLSEAYFLPISMLNEMRRAILEKLALVRAENRPVKTGGVIKNHIQHPEKTFLYTGNVLNKQAEAFYRNHGVTSIDPAAESGLDMHGKKVMTTRYCLKHQLNLCPKAGNPRQPSEPLYLIDAEGHKLELRFRCAKCEMDIFMPEC